MNKGREMIPAKEIDGELWVKAADARIKEAVELRMEMDLRDYFAAKAMQVILQDQYRDGIYVGDADNESEETCATSAYIVADAMLAEREK